MILFIDLKNILLQYFQFLILITINSIQMKDKLNERKQSRKSLSTRPQPKISFLQGFNLLHLFYYNYYNN